MKQAQDPFDLGFLDSLYILPLSDSVFADVQGKEDGTGGSSSTGSAQPCCSTCNCSSNYEDLDGEP